MVQWLSVSDTHHPLTVGTHIRHQVPPLAPPVSAGDQRGPAGLWEDHELPASTGDVSLYLAVDILSSAPGDKH